MYVLSWELMNRKSGCLSQTNEFKLLNNSAKNVNQISRIPNNISVPSYGSLKLDKTKILDIFMT